MENQVFGFRSHKKMRKRFMILSATLLLATGLIGCKANTKDEKSDILPAITIDQVYESENVYNGVIADSENSEQLYVCYSKDEGENWKS